MTESLAHCFSKCRSILASGSDLHKLTVTAVRPGSPAEQDGFAKGDVITALDGRTANEFTLGELREALMQEGTTRN